MAAREPIQSDAGSDTRAHLLPRAHTCSPGQAGPPVPRSAGLQRACQPAMVPPPGDIRQCLGTVWLLQMEGECSWHLVGAGQGCCWTPCKAQGPSLNRTPRAGLQGAGPRRTVRRACTTPREAPGKTPLSDLLPSCYIVL